jgi:hypothetical protein
MTIIDTTEPKSSWNYRVVESTALVGGEKETWRAVHEVSYYNDVPQSYSTRPATIVWDVDAGDDGAKRVLHRMLEALDKPILLAKDFTDTREVL